MVAGGGGGGARILKRASGIADVPGVRVSRVACCSVFWTPLIDPPDL